MLYCLEAFEYTLPREASVKLQNVLNTAIGFGMPSGFQMTRSELNLDPVHQIFLVHHVRLSVPAVVRQQGDVLGRD